MPLLQLKIVFEFLNSARDRLPENATPLQDYDHRLGHSTPLRDHLQVVSRPNEVPNIEIPT